MPMDRPGTRFIPFIFSEADPILRPTPTPETQALYNDMRRAELELSLAERISIQTKLDANRPQATDYLRPHASSRATSSSGSPSTHSHTPSTARDVVQTKQPAKTSPQARQSKTQRKSGRQGPLPRISKARAAFLRKIKACDHCRERKVKCTHHDLQDFEKGYILSRQAQARQSSRPKSQDSQSPPCFPTSQSRVLPGGSDSGVFLHMGLHMAKPSPGAVPYGAADDPQGPLHELDRMLEDMTFSYSPAHGSMSQPEPHTFGMSLLPSSFDQVISTHGTSPGCFERQLPISRQVEGYWICQWSEGTDSSDYGSLDVCGQRHVELSELAEHFRHEHAPFRDHEPTYFWICSQCHLKWDDHVSVCLQPQCSASGSFERWYFGLVTLSDPAMTNSPTGVSNKNAATTSPGFDFNRAWA